MTRPSEKKGTRGVASVQPYVPPVRGVAEVPEGQTEDHHANVKKALDRSEDERATAAEKPEANGEESESDD